MQSTKDPFLTRRNEVAELFLIRHGDAIPDADEIIPNGIYNNLALSKTGRKQAITLAERLKHLQFDAAYSSPLRRCQETAAPLIELLNLTPEIVEDIQEIRLGSVIDLPAPQETPDREELSRLLQERQQEIVRIAGDSGSWDSIEGSESSLAFRQRVVAALDRISQHHIGERVLIFAHGGVINAYVAEVLGLTRDFFFPCGNTSVTVVRVSHTEQLPPLRVLYILNDISHLLPIASSFR